MSTTRAGYLTDHYLVQQYLAPNGEVCSVPLYKLVGDSFGLAALDTGVWTANAGTGGTVDVAGGVLVMSTGTTANNTTSCVSVHTARFSGLAPNKVRIPLQLITAGTANNTRRFGVFTSTDGAFFELSGTTFKCVTRSNSVDSAISSGAFNGQYGLTFAPGTTSHFYEIIWQPRQVVFLADNKVIHTLSAAASTWSQTQHLPIRLENNNSGGLTTNVEMDVRLATIARFGIPQMQKDSHFIQGLTAAHVLKIGPGNLHTLAVSGVTNGADITLYDNTAASGEVVFSTGSMGPQTAPLALDMGGTAFNIGLTCAITGAAANAYIVFD